MKHVQDSRFLSPLRLPAGKIHVSARHADRAKSSVLGTRISRRQEALAKKKRQERKDPETAPWPVSITRLLWLRQWRTLFLAGRRSLRLPSSRGSSLLPASIRDGERNRTKGTSPIAPQRLPRHPRFLPVAPASSLYLPSFLLVLLRVPLVVPPVSPFLSTRKFTRPLRSDRLGTSSWTVFESASLFHFGSFSSLGYLHSAAGLFCRFNTHRMFECTVNNLSILFTLINYCIYTLSPS